MAKKIVIIILCTAISVILIPGAYGYWSKPIDIECSIEIKSYEPILPEAIPGMEASADGSNKGDAIQGDGEISHPEGAEPGQDENVTDKETGTPGAIEIR